MLVPSSDVTRTVIALSPVTSATWWPSALVSPSGMALPSASSQATEAWASFSVAVIVTVPTLAPTDTA